MIRHRLAIVGIAATTLFALSTAVHAATWIDNATGDWSDTTKWTGTVPNAVDDVADYGTATRNTTGTTTLDLNVTLGTLQINGSPPGVKNGDWTITASASETITMDVSSGNALIANFGASGSKLTINPNIVINDDLVVEAKNFDNQTANINLNGSITGVGNVTLTPTKGGNNASQRITAALINNTGSLLVNGQDRNTTEAIINAIGANVTTLTKDNTSELFLTGVNSYTGTTTINDGRVTVESGSNLGGGDIFVTGGVLDLQTDTAIGDLLSLDVTTGATLDLDFFGTDIVGDLLLDGSSLGIGTYNAGNTSFITGTGALQVVPEPTSIMAMLGLGGLLMIKRRRA